MSSSLWDDWTPGVLSKDQVLQLCNSGYITGVEDPDKAIDHSSIDLTLTDEGYHMSEGAVKPLGPRYKRYILKKEKLAKSLASPKDGVFVLNAKETYLFKLRERLEDLRHSGIHGQATAKSSVGRVDVLARLIVDGMDGYESFSPDSVASGDMYLEITPLTFSVCVKAGISLSQLRFFYGHPKDCEITGKEAYKTFLKGTNGQDGTLSVDLSPTNIRGHSVVAFCAHEGVTNTPVPLWRTDSPPDPCPFWRFVSSDKHNRISLRKGLFYILRSKEHIALPKGVAVYCRAIDETFGEMRIHYAGFVHPLFGRTRTDGVIGTPLIFEVRGHDVHVSLQDGERMARLIFYRMSEDASSGTSSYENQTLQLSKFFSDWPQEITVDSSGVVAPA